MPTENPNFEIEAAAAAGLRRASDHLRAAVAELRSTVPNIIRANDVAPVARVLAAVADADADLWQVTQMRPRGT